MSYADAIKEAYASCPADIVELVTIEIYHPTWAAPVRLVRDRVDLVATLEDDAPNDPGEEVEFTAFAFNFTLPKVGEGRQELTLEIDGATRPLVDLIESLDLSTDEPVKVIYRPYLTSDLSAPAMDPPLRLNARYITVETNRLTIPCGYADFANRRYPRRVYRVEDFPGLASRV